MTPSASARATSSPARSATSASRTAAGCASRSRSRTPTSSGCRTSGFQTVYRLFNAEDDVVCERVFLPPKQELAGAARRRARRSSRSSRRRRSATSTSSRSRCRSSGTTPTSLTMLRLAGVPAARRARTTHDPLVVIGGAVTFVNPEPLALFADVIAAGEGEVLVPRCRARSATATGSRRPAAPARRASAASTSRRSTTSRYAADGTIAAFEPQARHRRAGRREEGGA